MFHFLHFCWNTPNAVALSLEDQQEFVENAKIKRTMLDFNGQNMLKIEIQFDKKVISDRWIRAIDRDFGSLLQTDTLSQMTFADLQENRGINLMMNMLLHFENVKGRCGVEEPAATANYRQSIFWYEITYSLCIITIIRECAWTNLTAFGQQIRNRLSKDLTLSTIHCSTENDLGDRMRIWR